MLQLTNGAASDSKPAWSPDARNVFFLRSSPQGRAWYVVSALGGAERKLADVFPYFDLGNGNSPYGSPDGKFLASGSYQQGVQVWEVTTGTRRWVGRAQPAGIRRVAWSPDGSRLASGGEDGSVCLWQASDGRRLELPFGPAIFEFMERERERILQRDAAALEWLISECIKVKAAVVEADEREDDLRRILNFGHTIGHALEAETRYKYFLHGEAVGWGMVAASMIAAAMQKTSAETAQRIIAAVLAYAPLPKVTVRGKSVAKRVHADKKTTDGVVHFVLPKEIGEVEIVADVADRAVVQAVEELRYLSRE